MFACLLAVVSLSLLASRAGAQALVAVGSEAVFEYGNDGRSFEVRNPLVLRAGYGFDLLDAYLEYSQFQTASGISQLNVGRLHNEYMAWAKHGFFSNWLIHPYGAVGLGLQYEEVKTSFQGSASRATGQQELVFAFAGGFAMRIYRGLEAQLELRTDVASSNAPNPLPSLGAYLGYRF